MTKYHHLCTKLLILSSLSLGGACAEAPETEDSGDIETQSQALRRGGITHLRPEVGLVVFPNGSGCTGTLIGPRTVLTAAHCVDFRNKPLDGAHRATFLVTTTGHTSNASHHAIDGWRALGREFPGWENDIHTFLKQAEDDVAVMHLIHPVHHVAPATIANVMPSPNEVVSLFGLGRTGCNEAGAGGVFDGWRRAFAFRWKVDAEAVCPGDSGGPYFRANGPIFAVVSGHAYWPPLRDRLDVPARVVDDRARIRRFAAAWQ